MFVIISTIISRCKTDLWIYPKHFSSCGFCKKNKHFWIRKISLNEVSVSLCYIPSTDT